MQEKTKRLKNAVEVLFLNLLKDIFHENLLSVMIYGSYVSGDFVERVSDVNVLIILGKTLPEQLEEFGRRGTRILRKYNITPLILTKSEFASSADVFPIEYFDVKTRNQVLHGKDETALLVLSKKNLRHELEDRLRGSLASLKRLFITAAGKERALGASLKVWSGPFSALPRGMLRLFDIFPESQGVEAALEKIREKLGIDPEPFMRLDRFRKGARMDARGLFRDVLLRLEELVHVVDRMDVKD